MNEAYSDLLLLLLFLLCKDSSSGLEGMGTRWLSDLDRRLEVCVRGKIMGNGRLRRWLDMSSDSVFMYS